MSGFKSPLEFGSWDLAPGTWHLALYTWYWELGTRNPAHRNRHTEPGTWHPARIAKQS